MSAMNLVILMGNLGQDPILRQTASGKPVLNYSLAVDHTTVKTGADGKTVKETSPDWHNIVVWGDAATNQAKYLQKGSQVLIEGRLANRSYEDKNGVTQRRTEIIADKVRFLKNIRGNTPVETVSEEA